MAESSELAWSTWEELLLTCAVKRHGLSDWDSVAMELQSRTSVPLPLTPQVCRDKYDDLKRRFVVVDPTPHHHHYDEEQNETEDVDTIPWLEELRKLRVAELKQEVHRYDLSIQSLQSKVKRLEEEREQSFKEREKDDGEPDLEKNLEDDRSESDRNDGDGPPEEVAGGESSDRSFNESNSTENREAGDSKPEPVETGDSKPDPAYSGSKPAGEDSCNDSSDTVAKLAAAAAAAGKEDGGVPAEKRDSAGESTEGTKENSDVQSSASLTRKRRRKTEVSCGDEPVVVSPATIKREAVKSEPLIGLLDIIRSHKHGSMFERRLESQKTEEYKNMIRHHLDLETIQTRLNNGSYTSSSGTTKFFRDLLLLFNNAIVFFPKSSPELVAAYELRNLILKESKKERPDHSLDPPTQPKPKPERPDSLLLSSSKHKPSSAPPIVVCRKRSSISAKSPNVVVVVAKQIEEKVKPNLNPKPIVKNSESPNKLKIKEKPVTGTRSLRRNMKNPNYNNNNNNKLISKPNSKDEKEEGGEGVKMENKKKTEVTAAGKKRGAADFLKRIKRNSGTTTKTTTLVETVKSNGERRENNKNNNNKRGDGKEGVVAKRGGGGKKVKEEISPSKRGVGRPPKRGVDGGGTKRGREGGGGAEVGSKKRTRR